MSFPHQVFETLAWAVGFAVYLVERRRRGDVLAEPQRAWVVVGAVLGGIGGSRLLYLADSLVGPGAGSVAATAVFEGKSIVGGLLGGLLAVELVKKWLRVTVATGDALALPLTIGIAVGRIGCFLTGLADQTYGVASTLPWAVDFGDGIPRHPTQLYEIIFLAGLAALLLTRGRGLPTNGDRFKLFMVAYLSWRLLVEFIKPGVPVFGLSVIQWACVAGLAYYAPAVPRLLRGIRHE